MTLNEVQRKRIQQAFRSGNLNMNIEVENLVNQGFNQDEAVEQIKNEVNRFRQKLFDEKIKAEENEDYSKLAIFFVVLIGIVSPIFHITSIAWIVASILLSGGIGYWAYREQPIAGAVGCISAAILLPITFNWYLAERSSVIKIELLIPVILALLPSFLIGFVVSKILYQTK